MKNVEVDTKGLDDLEAMLRRQKGNIKVGILGSKPRQDGGSNAMIGLVHEYGSIKKNIPARSFLRIPLSCYLPKRLEESGVLDNNEIEQSVEKGSFMSLFRKIATIAENVVRESFETSGFGEWKKSDMTYKKNKQTLVESTQLRDSISSEVKIDK